MIDRIERENKKAVVLSLAAEKAFDRVNWQFLYQTLDRFGFNEQSVDLTRTLYQQLKLMGHYLHHLYTKRN